jgi:hypothetical protein
MSKQIVSENSMFTMYTEAERNEAFADYIKNSNNQKINSTEIVTIKKVNYTDELVAVTKSGYTYPIKKFQKEVKKNKSIPYILLYFLASTCL